MQPSHHGTFLSTFSSFRARDFSVSMDSIYIPSLSPTRPLSQLVDKTFFNIKKNFAAEAKKICRLFPLKFIFFSALFRARENAFHCCIFHIELLCLARSSVVVAFRVENFSFYQIDENFSFFFFTHCSLIFVDDKKCYHVCAEKKRKNEMWEREKRKNKWKNDGR